MQRSVDDRMSAYSMWKMERQSFWNGFSTIWSILKITGLTVSSPHPSTSQEYPPRARHAGLRRRSRLHVLFGTCHGPKHRQPLPRMHAWLPSTFSVHTGRSQAGSIHLEVDGRGEVVVVLAGSANAFLQHQRGSLCNAVSSCKKCKDLEHLLTCESRYSRAGRSRDELRALRLHESRSPKRSERGRSSM